jgi:hypothetical protein
MARRKSDTRSPGVVFTKQAADRIASAVRTVERGGGIGGAGHWGYRADEVDPIKRGTFTAPWNKGATVTVRDPTDSAVTYQVKNYFANVTGTGAKSCAIARVGDEWILIAAEC